MVDVMAEIMGAEAGETTNTNMNTNTNGGEGGGEGGGDAGGGGEGGDAAAAGNNNNNNNNNGRKRRKRSYESVDIVRSRLFESALESFENEPLNETIIMDYEKMAKVHVDNYFSKMKKNHYKRDTSGNSKNGNISKMRSPSKQVMVELLAFEFFGRLMDSYKDFKDYCIKVDYKDPDCAILETDWSVLGNH